MGCEASMPPHGCGRRASRARGQCPAESSAGQGRSTRAFRDTEEGEGKHGNDKAEAEAGEPCEKRGEGRPVPAEADLYDLPESAKVHGEARIPALFSRPGKAPVELWRARKADREAGLHGFFE